MASETDTQSAQGAEPMGDTGTGANEIAGVPIDRDETVQYDLRPSWANYTREIILGLATFWLLIGFWWLYKAYRDRRHTRYVITTQRFVHITGSWGATQTEEYPLADVERVQTSQGLVGSWFDVGDVTVTMLRQEARQDERFEIEIQGIPDYQGVAQALRIQEA